MYICQYTYIKMEQQTKLKLRASQEQVVSLQPNKLNLKHEKENFIANLCDFIEPLNFEQFI